MYPLENGGKGNPLVSGRYEKYKEGKEFREENSPEILAE